MAATTHSTLRIRLLLALAVLVSCSAWLIPTAEAADALACPPAVTSVLTSADYASCQRDVKTAHGPWVLTADHADAIARSDGCQATLRALHAVAFDTCVAPIASSSDSRVVMRVTVDKAALSALPMNSIVRRLRHAATRVLQDATGDQGTTFDYNYLYGGIAISLVVMLVICVLSRGGVCCFCIPIPLCC